MKWKKEGLICSHETFDLKWYRKNSMVPVPFLIDESRLRIFLTMCDENTVGRIGYVDVDPNNPSRILSYSERPVLDIGNDGTFDDNGVVTSSIFQENGKIYLFYSGYQLCVKVPYLIFSGVAISEDNGTTFKKFSDQIPILDRVEGELFTRCAPFVLKEGDTYRIWYTSDSETGWVDKNGKKLPVYDLKTATSDSPVKWPRKKGQVAIPLRAPDEHGIAKCSLWREQDKYKAIYSIRSHSKGYRLGYAESVDGINFHRNDELIGIDVSYEGWDSEMIAFPERFTFKNKTYLFYCGNGYGMGGIGYASLESE